MKTLFFIFIFILLFSFLHATIINVPTPYTSIQNGINAAANTDTVLVQPGTYVENINYNGKLITVGSLFLTTQDTTYISSTYIDGNSSGSVVIFENSEDSTAVLCGFTITNGSANYGGGIHCNSSSPSLQHVTITGNTAFGFYHYGGGIYCSNSNPILENVTITGNSAGSGGGISCKSSSSPFLNNVTISDNSATYIGGGICCEWYSSPSLVNVTISGNSADDGGGIFCYYNSSPILQNVTITGNIADYGGGIYCYESSPNFDPVDRCNIFLNFAGLSGCDLYASIIDTIDVIVDTFTVLQPDDYFAYPIDNFTFDILNAKTEQVNQDLYVSPDGSDNNSGLTVDDPLLTVSYALAKILADSTNSLTIHLSNGTYSPSGTGEIFPLNCRSYVSLLGEDEASTILDCEGLRGILVCTNDNNFSIENMTIQNGSATQGGGIFCDYSSPSLENVTITGNSSTWYGGGIYCASSSPILQNVTISGNTASDYGGGIYCSGSSPSLENVTISGNSANRGGGIYCKYSSPNLQNVTITGNTADNGGGIYFISSSPGLVNVIISGNSASSGGGIYCQDYSNPSLENITISGNTASATGGGIYCEYYSSPILINSILWNDSPQEIYIESGSVTATYSDIQGWWTGTGNINIDPLFIDPGNNNYYLLYNSPCIDAGDPSSPLDPDSTRIDMGAYYFDQSINGNPTITAVTDVPNDQGHFVIVTWQRSIWDQEFSAVPIVGYNLWEKYPYELDRECIITNDINNAIQKQGIYFQREDTTWVHIANIFAMQWEQYSALAETFFDSTTVGDYLSYFFVSAHTISPSLYFSSSVVSGYSVDNIAPDETRVYIAQNGSNIGLNWDEVEYGTFQGNSYPEINGIWYKIYAGDSPDFVCDEAHLVDTVTDLNYDYPLAGEEKKFFKIVVSDQP